MSINAMFGVSVSTGSAILGRTGLASVMGQALSGGGGGGPSIVAQAKSGGTANGVTTSGINTTGANFIVITASWYPGSTSSGTLSDSNGNTWTALTARSSNTLNKSQIFYCYSPIVGSGHTFTYSGTGIFPSIIVAAWNNIASSPFDQENGAASTIAQGTWASGSITPSQGNTVVIAALGFENNSGGSVTLDGGFTIIETNAYNSGNSEGSSLAYLILSSASAQNPTWDLGNPSVAAITAEIASFKY
jgi:hypothetical protein